MPSLNDFRHRMQVATRSAIYHPFLTKKASENVKFVENQKTLAWCPELLPVKKIRSLDGCREKTCSQTEPSDLPRHPTLNMVIFLHEYKKIEQIEKNCYKFLFVVFLKFQI